MAKRGRRAAASRNAFCRVAGCRKRPQSRLNVGTNGGYWVESRRPHSAPRGISMHLRITARCAAIAMVALAPLWAAAEEAKRPIPSNPMGAGGTWSQTVNKEAAIAGEEFDKKQM